MTDEGFTYAIPNPVPANNGDAPPQALDNRLRLEVDPRQVEAWELVVMESPRITDWMMVFSRYLVNGRGHISPNLPKTPLDELTEAERERILSSEAYRALKRFSLPDLKAAAQSFAQQAVSGF